MTWYSTVIPSFQTQIYALSEYVLTYSEWDGSSFDDEVIDRHLDVL